MGQTVHALIEHKLTPEEILQLPRLLQVSSNDTVAGQWNWTTPQIDKNVLIDLWSKKAEYFINNSWSEEDLALLEKDDLILHFFNHNLATFSTSLNWFSYNRNENLRNTFNELAKEISLLCSAVDILIVSDLSDDFIDEQEELSVELFRQKTSGNKNFAIELD